MLDTPHPAASIKPHSVGDPQPSIGRGDVAASHSQIDAGARASLASSGSTGEAGASNLPTYGPPTSNNPCDAGGPLNSFDCDIARALSRGDIDGAKALQTARAQCNLAFEKLEPVFVPSDGQRVFWGMVARLEAGETTFIDATVTDLGNGRSTVSA